MHCPPIAITNAQPPGLFDFPRLPPAPDRSRGGDFVWDLCGCDEVFSIRHGTRTEHVWERMGGSEPITVAEPQERRRDLTLSSESDDVIAVDEHMLMWCSSVSVKKVLWNSPSDSRMRERRTPALTHPSGSMNSPQRSGVSPLRRTMTSSYWPSRADHVSDLCWKENNHEDWPTVRHARSGSRSGLGQSSSAV